MFSSKVILSASLVLLSLSSAYGHAILATSEDAAQSAQRSQVTKGSTTSCPAVASGTAQADAQGVVTLFAKPFNGGTDGGTQFSCAASTTGAKGKFTDVKVTKNGNANTSNAQANQVVQIQVQAPDCPAGADCVLACKSNGGFGNCAPFSSAGGGGGNAAAAAAAADTTTAAAAAATGTGAGDAAAAGAAAKKGAQAKAAKKGKGKGQGKKAGKKAGKKGGKKAGKKAAAGAKKAGRDLAMDMLRVHARDFGLADTDLE